MSRSKVVLVSLLSFGVLPLLMGMEKERKLTSFKYSNPYFDSELQKTLTLIMLKNRNAKEVEALDKDTLRLIAKNSYDLYFNQLGNSYSKIKPDIFWLNNEDRINKYQGAYIEDKDFDLITMSDEGRELLSNVIHCIPMPWNNGGFHYRSTLFTVASESKTNTANDFLSQDDYNKTLDLPLKLRRQIGELCPVKAIGHPVYFWRNSTGAISILALANAFLGALGGAIENIIRNGVSCSNVGAACTVGLVMGIGTVATLGIIMICEEYQEFKKYGYRIKLVEKPLITPEEQEMIKKDSLKNLE